MRLEAEVQWSPGGQGVGDSPSFLPHDQELCTNAVKWMSGPPTFKPFSILFVAADVPPLHIGGPGTAGDVWPYHSSSLWRPPWGPFPARGRWGGVPLKESEGRMRCTRGAGTPHRAFSTGHATGFITRWNAGSQPHGTCHTWGACSPVCADGNSAFPILSTLSFVHNPTSSVHFGHMAWEGG